MFELFCVHYFLKTELYKFLFCWIHLQILEECLSKETLDTIVSHAMHCVLDGDKFYAYEVKDQGVFLLFNSFYELVQLSFDGVTSLNCHQLTSNQKVRQSSSWILLIKS